MESVPGHYDDALVSYNEALKLAEDRGDQHRKAEALSSIGGVYVNLGQNKKGIEYLQQTQNTYNKKVTKNSDIPMNMIHILRMGSLPSTKASTTRRSSHTTLRLKLQ